MGMDLKIYRKLKIYRLACRFLFFAISISVVSLVLVLHVRGVLGNKCAGHHNLKTVQMREIMFK